MCVCVCVFVCVCVCAVCVCVYIAFHRAAMIHTVTCMYVLCMYVCMYACMYICMYVCMHACMYIYMYYIYMLHIYTYYIPQSSNDSHGDVPKRTQPARCCARRSAGYYSDVHQKLNRVNRAIIEP